MKFYRYFKSPRGDKRFGVQEYTTQEVREALSKNNQRYFYLPVYQDRGDLRTVFYPCKPIETIEQLEEFVDPLKYTFVLDQDKWKIKIHTPEQLIRFYDSYAVSPFILLENIENIKKSSQNWTEYQENKILYLNDLCIADSRDAYTAYQVGIFQGNLMAFQMKQIERTGGILISEDFSYDFLESPTEHFEKEYVSDILEFPVNEQLLDDIEIN